MSNTADFERVWEKFITKFKGSLIGLSESQKLNYSNISILFDETAACWSISYDECGRWLNDFTKKDNDKGELVRNILTKDMKLTEIPEKKSFPGAAKIAVPAAGTAVGFGLARILSAPVWVQVLSAAAAPVLLYPVMTAAEDSANESAQRELLNEYAEQLDKYKKSVISVIEE